FAAGFFAAGFFAAGFFAAGFFAAGFLAAGFFLAVVLALGVVAIMFSSFSDARARRGFTPRGVLDPVKNKYLKSTREQIFVAQSLNFFLTPKIKHDEDVCVDQARVCLSGSRNATAVE
ncbi:MAG: hypothetical protein VW338_11050, partial [Rhodospirillaceae bacterium]